MILNGLAKKQSTAANSVIPPVTVTEGISGNQSSGQMPAMAQVASVGNRMMPPCRRQCCEGRLSCRYLKMDSTRRFQGDFALLQYAQEKLRGGFRNAHRQWPHK